MLMNRRRFLAVSGTVLATMATGCARLFSAPAPAPGLGLPSLKFGETRPLRVALLSDVHIQPERLAAPNAKLEAAAAELKAVSPDLWVVDGDISDRGLKAEFDAFKQIMAGVSAPDQLLVTTGNHEFYDEDATDEVALSRFQEAFGLTRPYSSHVVGDVHFVLLADEQWKTAPRKPDWAWITPQQLRWLEGVLNEHRDKFTCVFMHQPLNETVASSQGENAFGGTNAAREIEELLGRNPQVKLWFSGHTHRTLTAQNQVLKKGETTFVALGSTFYLIEPPAQPQPGNKPTRDTSASQSRVMDIFPDKVVIRARDHAAKRWLDELTVTLPRA